MARRRAVIAEGTPKTAIIYCRVSTTEQADSGLGLDAQQRKCEAYCDVTNWEVSEVFIDAGVSAKSLDRPALRQALDALRPGMVLVVAKLDRLTRSVSDLQPLSKAIEKAGADWVSVEERFDTTTACGRMMLGLMVVLSQFEREQLAERTSAALKEKIARGERLGATPLGYRVDDAGTIVVDQAEQVTVARARELRAEGLTLRAIAELLTSEGHKTKRGGRWQAETVRLLLSTRYFERIADKAL